MEQYKGNSLFDGEEKTIMEERTNVRRKNERIARRNVNKRNKSFISKEKKIIYIISVILVIIIIVLIANSVIYKKNLEPLAVNTEKAKTVTFEVKQGIGLKTLGNELEKEGLIKNSKAFVKYAKNTNKTNIKSGKYKISSSQSVKEILDIIISGKVSRGDIKIQLIEGKTLKTLVNVIEQNTNNKKEEILKVLKDKEFLKKMSEKFWFINYEEVTDTRIKEYYEGYLFPDTYYFTDKNVKVEEIIEEMLKHTEKKLVEYKEVKNKKLTPHQLLTLASIVELEAGTNSSKSEEQELTDREKVAKIFLNRIAKKMSLGSDVTTYYAFGVNMAERDLKKSELNAENPYNTRGPNMEGKLPVGPICMPSSSSIKAVVEILKDYQPSDELFFVSDKTGKIYTTKTNSEHEQLIKELRAKGLWFEYDKKQ